MSKYAIGKGDQEELSQPFVSHLVALNDLVVKSGARLEGNLFYKEADFADADKSQPHPGRAHKRRNFHRAVKDKRALLEIGFNAGHSALLALSSNPQLHYTGIDISKNAYVASTVAYMKKEFGERFQFFNGNSRDVLPYLSVARRDLVFDVFHVDGGHGIALCRSDIANCLNMRGDGQHLILDDTIAQHIMDIYMEFVSLGVLATETLGGQWEGRDNMLALMHPDGRK